MDNIPTNIPGLDDVIDGFRVGDNIILENTVAAPPHGFVRAAIQGAIERGEQVWYVTFDASPSAIRSRLGPLAAQVDILDCFSHGHGDASAAAQPPGEEHVVDAPYYPSEFQDRLERLPGSGTRFFVMDSLNGMALLWGEDRTRAFYATVCPRLFDQHDLALWVLHKGVQTPAFHAQIGHIAQVVLTLERTEGELGLQAERAVGRDARLQKRFAVAAEAAFGLVTQSRGAGAPRGRSSPKRRTPRGPGPHRP